MSHGTIVLSNIILLKISEISPSWVLNVTETLESLLYSLSGYECCTSRWPLICYLVIYSLSSLFPFIPMLWHYGK